MNVIDRAYLGMVKTVLYAGERVVTGGDACKRYFPVTATFRTTPLVSVRRTAWKTALREWEWFLSGSTNVNDAHPSVRPWWADWADETGCVNNNYSQQFRHARGDIDESVYTVDQVANLIDGIKNHPFSRRNVVTTWHPAEMWSPETPITNCHGTVIQAFVSNGKRLSLVTYQRSADLVVGVPHNWIQYWAFLVWLAARTGTGVGSLTWVGGDVHVYEVHNPLVRVMLDSEPVVRPVTPELRYNGTGGGFRADDFDLVGDYYPALDVKAELVVRNGRG